MTVDELLLQLQDIVPPPEPAWWLMSPAQILLAAGIIVILASAWLLIRLRRRYLLASSARRELQALRLEFERDRDSMSLAINLSRWIKRVALQAFPGNDLEGISGDRWLDYLDRSLGEKRFSAGIGNVFGKAIYGPQFETNGELLLELCEDWLNAIKPGLYRPESD